VSHHFIRFRTFRGRSRSHSSRQTIGGCVGDSGLWNRVGAVIRIMELCWSCELVVVNVLLLLAVVFQLKFLLSIKCSGRFIESFGNYKSENST
jgi:hypothetical protein